MWLKQIPKSKGFWFYTQVKSAKSHWSVLICAIFHKDYTTARLRVQWELNNWAVLLRRKLCLLVNAELSALLQQNRFGPCLSHRLGLSRTCVFSVILWNVPEKGVANLETSFIFTLTTERKKRKKKPTDLPNLFSCLLLFLLITYSVYKHHWASFHFPPQRIFLKHKETRSFRSLDYF